MRGELQGEKLDREWYHGKPVMSGLVESCFHANHVYHRPSRARWYIPSFEDLLGDKLTAFAPNTTGIPYFKKDDSMSMEIIKQRWKPISNMPFIMLKF